MSSAVHKWGTEIHEGIYNMLMLLVDLVAERVKQDPIPTGLMGVLTMVSAHSHTHTLSHIDPDMKALCRVSVSVSTSWPHIEKCCHGISFIIHISLNSISDIHYLLETQITF